MGWKNTDHWLTAPTQGHIAKMLQRRDLVLPHSARPRPKAATGPKKQKREAVAGQAVPPGWKGPMFYWKHVFLLLLIFLSLCNGMTLPLLLIFSLHFPLWILGTFFQTFSIFIDAYKAHIAAQGRDKNRQPQTPREREKGIKTGGEILRQNREKQLDSERETKGMMMTEAERPKQTQRSDSTFLT